MNGPIPCFFTFTIVTAGTIPHIRRQRMYAMSWNNIVIKRGGGAGVSEPLSYLASGMKCDHRRGGRNSRR